MRELPSRIGPVLLQLLGVKLCKVPLGFHFFIAVATAAAAVAADTVAEGLTGGLTVAGAL